MKKLSESNPATHAEMSQKTRSRLSAIVGAFSASGRIRRELAMLRARNKQMFGWFAGFAILLVCAGIVWAATTATITVGSQSGTANYGTAVTDSSLTFLISVSGAGNGGVTFDFTVSGLPAGATGTFSPTSA